MNWLLQRLLSSIHQFLAKIYLFDKNKIDLIFLFKITLSFKQNWNIIVIHYTLHTLTLYTVSRPSHPYTLHTLTHCTSSQRGTSCSGDFLQCIQIHGTLFFCWVHLCSYSICSKQYLSHVIFPLVFLCSSSMSPIWVISSISMLISFWLSLSHLSVSCFCSWGFLKFFNLYFSLSSVVLNCITIFVMLNSGLFSLLWLLVFHPSFPLEI